MVKSLLQQLKVTQKFCEERENIYAFYADKKKSFKKKKFYKVTVEANIATPNEPIDSERNTFLSLIYLFKFMSI